MKTLGILGGMGPMATVDLMRKVILATDAATDQENIPILLDNNTAIPDRTQAILGKGPSPAPEMLKSAKRLMAQGAEVLAIACNTAHYFLPEISPHIGVPVLDMVEETARACAAAGYRCVGLLASLGTWSAGLYRMPCERHGVRLLQPTAEQQGVLQALIYEGVKAQDMAYDASGVRRVLREMEEEGAEAFILGCTEVPVAVEMYRLEGRFVDATQVLARRAVEAVGARCRALPAA